MVFIEIKKIFNTKTKSNTNMGEKYKDFWKIFACCLVCIGGFSQGVMFCWGIPYISQTKDSIYNATNPHHLVTPYPMNWTNTELTKDTNSSQKPDAKYSHLACKKSISWISSSPNLGSVFGALLSGPLLLVFDPHHLIPMLSLATSISWFFVTYNPDSAICISIGRGLIGLFVSLQATYSPKYITQTAPTKYAFTLSSMLVVARNMGQVLTTSSTFYLGWIQMTYFYGVGPPLIIAILFFLLPKTSQPLESTVNKPTDEIAVAVISSEDIKEEKREDIKEEKREDIKEEKKEDIKEEKREDIKEERREDIKEEKRENISVVRKMFYLLLLGSSMCLSGMVPISTYVSYLLDLPSSFDNVYPYSDTTVALAYLVCGVLGSIISTILAVKVGRRSILLITSLFLALATASISAYYFFLPLYKLPALFYYIPLITFNILMFTFFTGIGTLFSVILGDIIPESGQSWTYPTIFVCLNVINFVQNYWFPLIVCQFQFMGIGIFFLFYTFVNLVSFIFTYIYRE